jgi:signal transduction histidine kinase/ActR/RegA family two-component response regulator
VEVIREVEVVKEVVREVPVEVIKEVVREVPVEVIKEVVKEVPVEVIKEVVREVPVEVPVEVIRQMDTVKVEKVEVPVEVIKEVVREVPVEVIKEVVREVPVEVIKEVVREVPVEVVKEVVKEIPVEVVRETTKVDEQEMLRLRRRLEELQTAHDQLVTMSGRVPVDEKMQALLTMAAGVGHIFNNVLAGILSRTQLLLKKAEREKQRDLVAGLSEIEAATRTGIEALTRVQEFSRSRPSEAFGRVDLNDVVQRGIEQSRAKWREEPSRKGVRVELITHFGAHAPVMGVETELLEALNQLIANAVDAMPKGGTLTIRTGIDGKRGFISVADTGQGMAENVKRRAFEPFYSTRGETGLGLGLSVVYGIMARHGGEATIDSEAAVGTTVNLRLPMSGEGAPEPTTLPDTDQSQILVVDDDETVRTALGDMLRGAGYAVTLAASGLEGIAKVREREGAFHLVVTDLGMPDVPGWEVVEAVKQVETATPVVIMSGFDRARATRRAKELGVDLVISKPFDLQEFLNAVRGLLLGRKRQ